MNASVSRRLRRNTETGSNDSSSPNTHNKSERSPALFSACLLVTATILVASCLFGSSVFRKPARNAKPVILIHTKHKYEFRKHAPNSNITAVETPPEPTEMGVLDALPILQDVYGKYMESVLHVGPGSCDVVASLLQEEGIGAWGIEPLDLDNPDKLCKALIKKGFVRVAEVYRSLPYRSKSFSLVYTTHTLEHLSSRQLNRTLPELARLAQHALVVLISSRPTHEHHGATYMQAAMKPIKHHNRTWWSRRFEMVGLEENEEISKQFESFQTEKAFKTSDYIFHFHVRHLD